MKSYSSHRRLTNEHFAAIRVAAVYAVFSLLWISLSDRVLLAFVQDVDRLTELQTYKGWTFVIVSALVVYFLLLREFRKIQRAQQMLVESEQNARHLSEQAAEARKQLQLLLDSTGEGIFGVNLEGEITFINRAASDLIGFDQDETDDQALEHLPRQIVIDGTPMFREGCVVDRVIKTNQPYHNEKGTLRREDGSVIDIEYRVYPIGDETG